MNESKQSESSKNINPLIDLLIELSLIDSFSKEEPGDRLKSETFENTLNSSLDAQKDIEELEPDDLLLNNSDKEPENLEIVDRVLSSQDTLEEKLLVDSISIEYPTVEEDVIRLRQTVRNLESQLSQQSTQIQSVLESMNALMPLIRELLTIKIEDSRDVILQSVAPVIDRIIEIRAAQDLEKMSVALAQVIPLAIAREIKTAPQAIAKALAPEVALSIQEQIVLDEDAIANTLGPEMGKAIKTQIEVERDAMVDALYPVIGNTIAKYMAEVIQAIDRRVENSLSLEGIKRKIRAKIQGVSEAELILAASLSYQVQAVYLIHKLSGLLIEEFHPLLDRQVESSDLLAGMLTAIRSFIADCIAESNRVSEVNEIEYGDSKIILEVAGYCYLAVVVKGQPSQAFLNFIRESLGKIVLKYGKAIEEFDGDRDRLPKAISSILVTVGQFQDPPESHKPPKTLRNLLIFFSTIVLLPWAYFTYRHNEFRHIEAQSALELDGAPELSVYRIVPQVNDKKLILTGRVPNQYLKNKAADVIEPLVEKKGLQLDNRLLAVKIPADPTMIAEEIARVTSLFNRRANFALSSQYDHPELTLQGIIPQDFDVREVVLAFKQIPGVENIIVNVSRELPNLKTRIYFDSASDRVELAKISSQIEKIEQIMQSNDRLSLRIIGRTDSVGEEKTNTELALKRARAVQKVLRDRGIPADRLKVLQSNTSVLKLSNTEPLWLSRCVYFEFFIP